LTSVIGFPRQVDEVSARLVATGVVLEAGAALALRSPVLAVTLWAGFVLRVLSGPRLSPLALVATRVVRPRLAVAPRIVPGSPKRFAQGIGASLTTVVVALLASGHPTPAWALLALLVGFASLEAALGLCVGCKIYALLGRAHLVPECPECDDISARLAQRVAV
jgi:hypothetical protein